MEQLLPGVVASLIAAFIAALAGVAARPVSQALRRVRDRARLLEEQRQRVRELEYAIRTVRNLLLGIEGPGIECDLAKVRRDVKTRLQWSKPEPTVVDIAPTTRTIRIDRGVHDGVVEGMKARIWSRAGGPLEEYRIQSHDIDDRHTHLRPSHQDLLTCSKCELRVSFVTPATLTSLEIALANVLSIIDGAVPD